jgi:hypothetical protein
MTDQEMSVHTQKDERGVSWEAVFVFGRYYARSTRGEQFEAGDLAGINAEIERRAERRKR